MKYSFLIEERYIAFFTDETSPFEAVWTLPGTNAHEYAPIMDEFKERVVRAASMAGVAGGPHIKPVWADMRDKYFNGLPHVWADEMILKIDCFDEREIIAFLHHCVVYKERFFDGAYGCYAKEGIIGQLLMKLTTMVQKQDEG